MPKKRDPRRRIFRASKDAQAGLVLTDKTAQLVGNSQNFIAVDDTGIYLRGPISMIAGGTGMRKGGLFVQMPDLIRMIPSTMVTPLPMQIPLPPIQGLTNIAKDVAFFSATLV